MAKRDFYLVMLLALPSLVFLQRHTTAAAAQSKVSGPDQAEMSDILQAKVKAEWEAFKKRDKNAYGDLLADDFMAVEDDGDGERNKIHAVREVAASNIQNYSLSFFKSLPLSADAAFVTYEVTMEFPTKSVNRFKRLFISELWVKRSGQWKARCYQETRVK